MRGIDLNIRIDSERIRRFVQSLLSPSDRQLSYLAIGLLFLLGVVLVWTRLMHIDQSLLHDEAATVINFIQDGPTAILYVAGGSFNPNNHVAFNFLSWLTVSLWGESEPMFRLWSVLPGIAAIGVVVWWAWNRLGPIVAVAVAAIGVAAPIQLIYTTQARGYGLALLAASLLLVAADRVTQTRSRLTLVGFLGAGLLGIFTLVTFAFAFVGQALALLRWRDLRLPMITVVGVAGILSIAFYVPVMGDVTSFQVGGETIPLIAALLLDRPLEWMVIPTITLLTGDEGRPALVGDGVAPDAPWATGIDVLALALYVGGLVALWRRGNGGLALILVLPPLVFNLWLALDQQSTTVRHQSFLLPYMILPVAVTIAELGRRAARIRVLRPVAVAAGVALALALAVQMVKEGQSQALPLENPKEAARVVSGTGLDTVVTETDRPQTFRYYLGDEVLTRLSTEETEALLCDRDREFVYIRAIARRPSEAWRPASLDCLAEREAARVRVPQRAYGDAIDVWIVGYTASDGINDDLPLAGGDVRDNGAATVTEESLPLSFDFEDGTEGWGPSSDGVTIERSTQRARSGEASMAVATPGNGPDEGALMNHGASGPRVLVEPGGTYTATAWVRAPAGSQMNFIIRERTAKGDSVGTTSVNVEPTGEWQRVSATRTFTSGDRITVEFRPAAIQDVTFQVDDVAIREDRSGAGGVGE
jgi:hypothetical protein